MYKRIFIFGGTGSGKTTFASKLSRKLRIPFYTTDNLIYKQIGGEKYSESERDNSLREIAKKKDWIIEGVHADKWILPAFEKSDFVIFIGTGKVKMFGRTLRRYLFKEKEHYKGIKNLLSMLYWTQIYYTSKGNFPIHKKLVRDYQKKSIILKNNTEISSFLNSLD